MNETLQVLRRRRSIRKYLPTPIREKELNAILDAGTWAPSGMGRQSAVMVVIQDPEVRALLSRETAQAQGSPNYDPFYGAPTVVAVLADTSSNNWLKDGTLVMGNLMNAAASLNVGSCWINRCDDVFDAPAGAALRARWGLPASFRGVGFCILGYADGPAPKARPRKENYILRP